jgi:hypothetical protein
MGPRVGLDVCENFRPHRDCLLCFLAGKHNRLNHDTPTHRPINQHYMINHHIDLYFHVTQTDPEARSRWQTIAETCMSQHIE